MQTIQIDKQIADYFLEFDIHIKDYKMKHFDERIKELNNIHNKGGVNDSKKENN